MAHAVATTDHVKDGEARLSELIRLLETRPELSLLVEHLNSAHTYLLGGMPREFAASMADARWAAGQVANPSFRKSLEGAIELLFSNMQGEGLVERTHQTLEKPQKPSPARAQSRLWNFFSTNDVSFGVFYPKNHIIATFPTYERAVAGANALNSAGFSRQEAVAANAEEMLLFLAELKDHLGLWGKIMGEVSQFFGTEEIFDKRDADEASHGAGFLAVYCPPEQECARVQHILEPFGAVAMQRYLATGIQSLI